ncbi:MAG: efflux RND transporter permease subunit [Saprospiraceae bacterium]|nr:efflux RND transporter permease subunit [Saprospiraceae bacterium]
MLGWIVESSLKQRIVVLVLAVLALGFGIDAARKLSVDAFPDVTSVQVQVATEVPGRSPDEVERMVTVPVEIGMTGLPGMTEMRSQNEPGLSIVTLVFSDETPLYFSNAAGPMAPGDFLEFYGKKNRAELDRHLFRNPDADLFNPEFSLISDTIFYFLTWDETPGQPALRYQDTPNDLSNLPAKEAWFWYEEKIINTAGVRKQSFNDVSESVFLAGEGYGSAFANAHTLSIQPKFNDPNAGVDARFDLRLFSNNSAHNLKITVNGTEMHTNAFNGYRVVAPVIAKPAASLSATEQIVITGAASASDQFAYSVVSLRHPRRFNFDNKTTFAFQIQGNGTEQYLEIENFDAGAANPVLYDLSNRLRLTGIAESGVFKFKLPAATGPRDLVLVNAQTGFRTVGTIRPVAFTDYSASNAQFIIISSTRLFNDGQGGNPVAEYADYRSSPDGGSYRTVVAAIEQLYDQFAYGVPRHPLSIRNFAHFAKKEWTDPRYVLLIGKGREYNTVRTAAALAQPQNSSFLVPTFGFPGADNLLLASNYSVVPVFPIGRIPAETPGEIRAYLDKVRAHEAPQGQTPAEDRLWRKQVVHLGGGGSALEQNDIRNKLNNMKASLENSEYGASVSSFFKTSPDPIQYSQSEAISNRINAGASIVTFFGHSSSGGFDFSIDNPAIYQNQNRYPLIISLGCLSGAIHQGGKSVGENFVFQENKGALAFIASVGLGAVSSLYSVTSELYAELGHESYGKGIGDAIRRTLERFDNTGGIFTRSLVQQYTLNGDPALALSLSEKPDFFINSNSPKFEPEAINAQMDSFDFRFSLVNAGRASVDSVEVLIRRTLPRNIELELPKMKVPAPKYENSVVIRIPVLGKLAIGENRFRITVDPGNAIPETPVPIAEQNNELLNNLGEAGITKYIFDNGVNIAWPPNFAIVGQAPVSLYASTADIFASERNYLMEIDTTEWFNSPQLRRTTIRQKGGLLPWTPDVNWQDSTVYYWRVSPDTSGVSGYIWSNASFIYLNGSPQGWNQSHYFQFEQDLFTDMEISDTTRQFKFLDDLKTVSITNGVFPGVYPDLVVNNTSSFYLPYDEPWVRGGLYISVLDSITGAPWPNNKPGYYGSQLGTSWATNWACFPFSTQSAGRREQVIKFLRDTIPSGNYVLIFTIQNGNNHYQPAQWAADSVAYGNNLFQLMEQQGATLIRSTASPEVGPRPYVFFYKKDDPDYPVFEQLVPNGDTIRQPFLIEGIWDNGKVHSRPAGPARQWDQLHWAVEAANPEDQYSLDLYGIRGDSTQQLLASGLTVRDTSLDWVNAAEYPYLRLELNAADTFLRSSPQLLRWRTTYEGLPEAALDPAAFFQFQRDTVQQGEAVALRIGVRSLNPNDMDSLLVRYVLTDDANNLVSRSFRVRPLPGKDTLILSVKIDTRTLSGRQRLNFAINPNYDQPELFDHNNFGFYEFFVERDKRNPLVEVTFDGTPILDGDLVSAKPFIAISLRDENPFLPLADTSVLKLLLRYPDASDVTTIPFSDPRVRFFPADASNLDRQNRALVEFTPQFTQSGTYELTVQGRDATGNASGDLDYRVSFEVETASKISNVFNYPNPFSTSTQFVYTLTGAEPPAQFAIRIMTVSGRVVREITQAELGPMKIGTHRTDFVWDGTDAYGDRLANGVYLYQVFAKDAQGKDYERYDNGTDGYFKNGIGKLVILR